MRILPDIVSPRQRTNIRSCGGNQILWRLPRAKSQHAQSSSQFSYRIETKRKVRPARLNATLNDPKFPANEKKFLGSFFQKRTASLLPQLCEKISGSS
jgi:hypothetical protein